MGLLQRQAEISKGAVAAVVLDDPRDQLVSQVEQACTLVLNSRALRPAFIHSSRVAVEHEDALSIQLPVILRGDGPVPPHTNPVEEPLLHPLNPDPGSPASTPTSTYS